MATIKMMTREIHREFDLWMKATILRTEGRNNSYFPFKVQVSWARTKTDKHPHFRGQGNKHSLADGRTLNCQLTTSKARYVAFRRRWGGTFECRLSLIVLITCKKPPSLDRGHEPCRDEINYRDDHCSAPRTSLSQVGRFRSCNCSFYGK
jgi:hypothetical protein